MDSMELFDDIISINVVSTIGFGISILFLCSHLIVYSITEDMWTLTGNSLASFCISLLLSHCSYIAGMVVEHENTPCTIMALLNYYFFLSSSFWLLSMTYELHKSSRKTKSQREYELRSTCKFISYSLFSWIQPAIILGVAMFLEKNNIWNMPKSFQVDLFPKGSYCFSKNTSILLWFLIFFNINLLLTFIMSGLTLFGVCAKYPNVHNDDFFVLLKFYMRLSLLVGCIWILGMCMLYSKNGMLYIMFAFGNGSLGLYIFLVFTFNNKISNLVFHEDRTYSLETINSNEDGDPVTFYKTRSPITSDV